MTNYLILLPPSEGKASGGNVGEVSLSFSGLNSARYEVGSVLSSAAQVTDLPALEKLFELKGEKALAARDMTLDSTPLVLPAISRYTGVMFAALNYPSFNSVSRNSFDESVVFIDGRFGLVRPLDLIPDYKLKIGSRIGDLRVSLFWRERLSSLWCELFSGKLVIDLLPDAHRSVVDFSGMNVVRVMFADIIDGDVVNVGHKSKKLKGEFIRYLVSFNELDIESIRNFVHSEGYTFNEEFSAGGLIVFGKG